MSGPFAGYIVAAWGLFFAVAGGLLASAWARKRAAVRRRPERGEGQKEGREEEAEGRGAER